VRQIILPAARILFHHQPAADVKHQAGGDDNDDALENIAVLARVQDRKQPRRDDAGADRGQRAAIESLDAVTSTRLGQIAGECGDHQHGFEPLAEQDDGGLDEC
jgi:hypothetical protein